MDSSSYDYSKLVMVVMATGMQFPMVEVQFYYCSGWTTWWQVNELIGVRA